MTQPPAAVPTTSSPSRCLCLVRPTLVRRGYSRRTPACRGCCRLARTSPSAWSGRKRSLEPPLRLPPLSVPLIPSDYSRSFQVGPQLTALPPPVTFGSPLAAVHVAFSRALYHHEAGWHEAPAGSRTSSRPTLALAHNAGLAEYAADDFCCR